MAHQRKSNTLELRLVLRYGGIKATQYFSKFTPESDKVFRDDILALRLPHPKRENTNFLSHGSVECFWPETQRNGVLHKHVVSKALPQTPELQRTLDDKLKELSISTLTLKQGPYDIKTLKRSYPQNYAPENTFRSQTNPYTLVLDDSHDSLPTPHEDTSRPLKVAKTHSGTFQLPQRPSSSYGSANSIATSSNKKPDASDNVVNSFLRDLSTDLIGPQPSVTDEEIIPGLKNPQLREPPSLPTPPSTGRSDSHATTQRTTSSWTSSRWDVPAKQEPQIVLLPPAPASALISSLPPGSIADLASALEKLEERRRAEQSSKDNEVNVLKRKLQTIEEDLARERWERDEVMRMLDEERREGDALRRILDEERRKEVDLRRSIYEEQREGGELRRMLDEERGLREETQRALEDVKRECRHPFVVPSLFDAFVEVSKMTTRGLNIGHGNSTSAHGSPELQRRQDIRRDVRPPPYGTGKERVRGPEPRVKMEPIDDVYEFPR